MKILFLDVDGVLIHDGYKNSNDKNIDRAKVLLIKEILEETSANIVLTSNWRIEKNEEYFILKKILLEYGMDIYDETEDIPFVFDFKYKRLNPYTGRSGEIYDYLNSHDIENFVIIDDIDTNFDFFDFDKNLIKTNSSLGITFDLAFQAVGILNEKRKIK